MLGDAGFWVPEDTLSKYMSTAGPLVDEEASSAKVGLFASLFRLG